MALTKSDLADRLTSDMSVDKLDAKVLVETVFETIREALTDGQSVRVSGFGNWEPREKSERPGRNPKTGENIPISARRVVIFGAGQKLKQRVEENTDNIRLQDAEEA